MDKSQRQTMMDIVAKAGKHKNPWTGSGGMLLGTVEEIGPAYVGRPERLATRSQH